MRFTKKELEEKLDKALLDLGLRHGWIHSRRNYDMNDCFLRPTVRMKQKCLELETAGMIDAINKNQYKILEIIPLTNEDGTWRSCDEIVKIVRELMMHHYLKRI